MLSGGVLEVVDDSYGFLRGESLLPAPTDVYVSQAHVRGHDLRSGDYVIGPVRPPKSGEKYYGLQDAVLVNGAEPELAKQRPHFETLTAVFPHQRFTIESEDPTELSGRVIDLVAPMGRGPARADRLAAQAARPCCCRRSPTASPPTTPTST